MSKHLNIFICILLITTLLLRLSVVQAESTIITDALGRSVEIPHTPRRVVSLSPSITEILVVLGVDNSIVGADTISLSDWYMNTSSRLAERGVVNVGGYWWSVVDKEKMLELQPDLVLADKGAHRPLLEWFESYNITVIYLNGGSSRSINDIYSDIYTLGLIFNKTSKAQEVINRIDNAYRDTVSMFRDYWGTRILVVIGFWQGIWVVGKGTFIDDALNRLGLLNSAQVFGWAPVSMETLSQWDPDVIIVSDPTITNDTLKDAGLLDINKPIIVLNSTEIDIVSRPGPLIEYLPNVMYRALSSLNVTITKQPTVVVEDRAPIFMEPVTALIVLVVIVVSGILGYIIGYKRGSKP